jgi:hypothetical protein
MTLEEAEAEAEDGKRTVHTLKCWPAYFEAIERGDKTFEVRRDDRGFQKGDILNLVEYDPKKPTEGQRFTGNATQVLVSYVLTGGQFGIEPGHVVMGLQRFDEE